MKPLHRFFIFGTVVVLMCILLGILFRFLSPHQADVTDGASTNEQKLVSFYQNERDYLEAFEAAGTPPVTPVHAAITSHHFLAKSLIARTLAGIDSSQIKTVLLISPDHFSAIEDVDTLGVTTLARWDTPFGEVSQNPGQIEALTTTNLVEVQRRPFLTEHGIYTLVPFIKKQLPDATLVPLILRQSTDDQRYQQFGKSLQQLYDPQETLLLISSDFTHDKTPIDAQLDDQKSIQALERKQLSAVGDISSDCRICFAVMLGYLDGIDTRFQLIENKNSFDLSGQSPETVTSYVSGYFTTASQQNTIKLLFGGDLMFDRNIRLKMKQFGLTHPLQALTPLFSQYDLVIANLEGPVTDNASTSVGSIPGSPANFSFTFEPGVAQTLYDQQLRVVNLGNNHILNFGKDGVAQTRQYLQQAHVQYFGDTGMETDSRDRTIVIERAGTKIGFANYNQFTSNGFDHALADIQYLRPHVDVLIVYTHWGNEYVPTANTVITSQAHQLIDAGADLIIGSHPHVVQNTEQYQGKTIYYSLGNMVFDQYFSPEVQAGLLVGVELDPQSLEMKFTEYPIQLKTNGQTVLVP